MNALGGSPFAQLPVIAGGWRCLLADPPWKFKSNSAVKPGRNARRHYACLAPEMIAALPVNGVVASDALAFLWVPGPFLAVGAHVPILRAWGFKPTAMGFEWIKLKRLATPPYVLPNDLFVSTGLTTRKSVEFVVIGKRGSPGRLAKDVAEAVFAPVREHSRKPPDVHERIERYCAGPRLELFARESRDRWAAWGDEVTKFDPAELVAP